MQRLRKYDYIRQTTASMRTPSDLKLFILALAEIVFLWKFVANTQKTGRHFEGILH